MRYRYLDHTSDLGFEIYGKDLPELFTNGLHAVFDNIIDLNTVEVKEIRKIELSAQSVEELFMDWFRELIFIFATQYFICKQVNFINLQDNKLIAEVAGETFDVTRHKIKIEIKTPTYHMYNIKKTDNGYQATIVFDV